MRHPFCKLCERLHHSACRRDDIGLNPACAKILTHGHYPLNLGLIGIFDKLTMPPQHCWGGQEDLRPVLMGHEEAKEPGALGEPREQWPIVARQPAIEGPVAPAFEGMEQPQGDHFTGPEVRSGCLGRPARWSST